jgi:hypothetical protein
MNRPAPSLEPNVCSSIDSRDDFTERAASLAESILDEVSRLEQDWRNVAESALELAQLAVVALSTPEREP